MTAAGRGQAGDLAHPYGRDRGGEAPQRRPSRTVGVSAGTQRREQP
jgi:hypothetical protein